MLDAGVRMLMECPGPDVLAALRPVDVARRCEPPRTTGAFYNIWPTQPDFRRALLDHVLRLDQLQADDAITELLLKATADPDTPPREAFRITANLSFDELKDDPAFRLQHALWNRADADPEVRTRLQRLYASISTTMIPRYEELLAGSGRRMAAPHTLATMAVALTALFEGLVLRYAVDPDAVPDDAGPPAGVDGDREAPRWSTYACLAHTLMLGMTEPDPEPDPG